MFISCFLFSHANSQKNILCKLLKVLQKLYHFKFAHYSCTVFWFVFFKREWNCNGVSINNGLYTICNIFSTHSVDMLNYFVNLQHTYFNIVVRYIQVLQLSFVNMQNIIISTCNLLMLSVHKIYSYLTR